MFRKLKDAFRVPQAFLHCAHSACCTPASSLLPPHPAFRPLLRAASVVCSHHCSPWRESGAPWLSFRRPCIHRICSEQLFKRGQADGALGVSWGKYSAEVAPRRVWLKSVREEPVKELSFHGVWAWGDQQGLCPVTPGTGRAAAPGEHEAVLSAGL